MGDWFSPVTSLKRMEEEMEEKVGWVEAEEGRC